MSAVAEMVENYARIKRESWYAPPPKPAKAVPKPVAPPALQPAAFAIWTPAQETDMWLLEDAKPLTPPRINIETIQLAVCALYEVSRCDLLSARRTAVVVLPRQIAMYLAKTLTLKSLPEIGRRFGGRDHTTVLHAVRKIEGLVAIDPDLDEQIQILKEQLRPVAR